MTRQPRGFWVGLLVGAPILAVGVVGALGDARDARPADLARWMIGGAVLHDGVVVPAVALVAVLGARLVPAWLWPAARWALATTAVVVVVGWPFMAGYGRRESNPSALARDYGTGVAVAVTAVWTAALVVAVASRRRQSSGDR